MKQYVWNKTKSTWVIFRKAFIQFIANNPVNLAATTAYFAIFSLAPILIIIISVFGHFTGDETVSAKLFEELNLFIGPENTQFLAKAIQNYQLKENSGLGAIIGGGFFLISATTLFSVVQDSINYIWRVKVKSKLKQGILILAKYRLFSFGVILCLGFVLLASMLVDAAISLLKDFLKTYFSPDFVFLAHLVNIALSLAIVTSVFALIYRFLPDLKIRWSAAWHGAFFTALLFVIGKSLVGLIISNSNLGAVYGTASSLVIILLWIYFMSLIFYFGVELSRQYSRFHGHNNTPHSYAISFEITPIEH